MISTIIFGVILLSLLRNVYSLLRNPDGDYREVLRAWRWGMLPVALGTICFVAGAAFLLLKVPFMSFSWLNLLGLNGQNLNSGNVSTLTHNSSWFSYLIATLFVLCLAILLPIFALREERAFRADFHTDSPLMRIVGSLIFGLVHMLVGVPLGVALALSIGGYIFGLSYSHYYKKVNKYAIEVFQATQKEKLKGLFTPYLESDASGATVEESAIAPQVLYSMMDHEDKAKTGEKFSTYQTKALYHSAALHYTYNMVFVLAMGATIVITLLNIQ